MLITAISLYTSCTLGAPLRQDREAHFYVGAASSLSVFQLAKMGGHSNTESMCFGMGFAIVLQLMKESMDYKWDNSDLGSGALGASVGVMIPISFEF